jgi:hypothetical protein
MADNEDRDDGRVDGVSHAPGPLGRLLGRLRRKLQAIDRHCCAVEQAKEAGERANTLKHGKDWVNRCCG